MRLAVPALVARSRQDWFGGSGGWTGSTVTAVPWVATSDMMSPISLPSPAS
jgi:hypothetical protein